MTACRFMFKLYEVEIPKIDISGPTQHLDPTNQSSQPVAVVPSKGNGMQM